MLLEDEEIAEGSSPRERGKLEWLTDEQYEIRLIPA